MDEFKGVTRRTTSFSRIKQDKNSKKKVRLMHGKA